MLKKIIRFNIYIARESLLTRVRECRTSQGGVKTDWPSQKRTVVSNIAKGRPLIYKGRAPP